MAKMDEERISQSREYLADDFNAQVEGWGDNYEKWFEGLEGYIRELANDDSLTVRWAEYLAPFLDDDHGLDGTLYPFGEAVTFMDEEVPEGDYRSYLGLFTNLLQVDYSRWRAHQAAVGTEKAGWTLESGPPEN